MKLLQSFFCLTISIVSPLTYAISIGSISDTLENNSSLGNVKGARPQPLQPPTSQTVASPRIAPVAQTSPAASTAKKTFPNPALFIEDSAMTGYVHAQFLLQKNIPHVNVTTENAVVSLEGTVDTQEQADTLVKVASSVKGVKFVNTDNLKIKT